MSLSKPFMVESFEQLNHYCAYEVLKYLRFKDLIKFERVNKSFAGNCNSVLKGWTSFSTDKSRRLHGEPFCSDKSHKMRLYSYSDCYPNKKALKYIVKKLPIKCPNLRVLH